MKHLLTTKGLSKEFQPGRGAVDVTLEISKGEIVGFLGPNGAGKTTTISMLMGLLKRDMGSLTIFGNEITSFSDYPKIYSKIGFLPSEPAYYDDLTAAEMFAYQSKLHGRKDIATADIEKLAKRLNLDLQKKISKMSLGNKRKTGIILSLLGNPELIIMDEPTSGLDPLVQREVLDILTESASLGAGIFLSSHNLSEVESICDRIIVIKDTKIIFSGTIKDIKSKKQKKVTFTVPEKQVKKLLEGVSVTEMKRKNDQVTILTATHEKLILNLINEKVSDFTVENPTLEEMFMNYYK